MKNITLWLLLLVVASTYAQDKCTLTLRGAVIDEHDASGLAYADIWFTDGSKQVVANSAGSFRIENLCEGRHTINVAHVGCDTLVQTISIKGDTQLSFYLEHHLELLEIVKIEAVRPHDDIFARQVVDQEKIERMQAMSYAELLTDELGVQMNQTGGNIAKPMLHGLSGNRIALRDNGVMLEGQIWGSEHAPEIDPYAMEEVEVIYGASSLRYGPEALAGAIVSKRKSDTNRVVNGWVHLNGASNGRSGNASALLRGAPIKGLPLFAYAQGTLGRSGDLSAPDYMLDNTATANAHGQGGLTWRGENFGAHLEYRRFNTRLGILSYAHVGNLTDLRQALENERPMNASEQFNYSINRPYQNVEHEVGAGEFWWRPQLQTKIQLNVDRQYNLRQEFDNSIFSDDRADLQYELTTHTAQLIMDHRFNAVLKTEAGLHFQRQANTYTGRFFIPNYLAFEVGAFVIQHITLDKHEIELGLRYDQRNQQAFMFRKDTLYSPERSFSGLSWNLGYRFDAGGIASISSNIAQGWRPPAINELYSDGLHHGAAAIEVGDELLEEERTWSWMNQVDFTDFFFMGYRWDVMLRGYASYFDQFIYLVPTGTPELTIRGAFPSFEYRGVEALLAGLDASLSTRMSRHWSTSVGLEMVRGQEWASWTPLIFMPADRIDAQVCYQFTTGEPGRYLALRATVVNEQFRVPADVDYAPAPDAYALLGAELGWDIQLSRSFRMIAALRVNNLLNTRYRSYTNRLRYFADEMGRNVALSVRIPINFNPKSNQTQIIEP